MRCLSGHSLLRPVLSRSTQLSSSACKHWNLNKCLLFPRMLLAIHMEWKTLSWGEKKELDLVSVEYFILGFVSLWPIIDIVYIYLFIYLKSSLIPSSSSTKWQDWGAFYSVGTILRDSVKMRPVLFAVYRLFLEYLGDGKSETFPEFQSLSWNCVDEVVVLLNSNSLFMYRQFRCWS